jgi:hypothetical protein
MDTMYVPAFRQDFSPGISGGVENRPTIATRSGTGLPPERNSDSVSISETGQSRLDRELQNLKKGAKVHQLFDTRGPEGKYRFGLIALGSNTVSEWRDKGLDISEAAVLAAADAFQAGLRSNGEMNGSSSAGSYVALNRHQIVMNHQQVPDWFKQEYLSSLSSMDSGHIKNAFESGALYVAGRTHTPDAKSLARYTELAAYK